MFDFLKRREYKNQVLSCLLSLLYLYPRGRDNIVKDYPGIYESIKNNFEKDIKPQKAALFAASNILVNLVEAISSDQRALIFQQLQTLNSQQMKGILRDVTAGVPLPEEITFGTIMLSQAIVVAKALVDNKEAEQSDYDLFASEVFGALSGKSADERYSERMTAVLDELMPLPEIREGDDGPLLPTPKIQNELPPLSGVEVKVKLVSTPTGIALFRLDDGQQITERRTLSQEVLQTVPQGLDVYRFVNLHARSGEIYSCIIAGADVQVFGSMHAFWWSLAKVNIETTDRKARTTRMTQTALAHVHASARNMWDTAIKETHTIDHMRDLIMPLRNVHLEVINGLKAKTTNEAERLGLEIAFAMILATQSEDQKLEAFAFDCFKRFLWQPGEEPAEFYEHAQLRT